MSMYVLFQWFEVTSIELFLFAFVYSSLLTAYLIKPVWLTVICIKQFSTLLDEMSHAWLIKIKIRNYFSLKKTTKKLAYCATTKKIDLISLSLNT